MPIDLLSSKQISIYAQKNTNVKFQIELPRKRGSGSGATRGNPGRPVRLEAQGDRRAAAARDALAVRQAEAVPRDGPQSAASVRRVGRSRPDKRRPPPVPHPLLSGGRHDGSARDARAERRPRPLPGPH